LYARGSEFLEKYGQSSTDCVKLDLPDEQLCRRIWTTKSDSTQVVIAELEDPNTGKKVLYSAGKCEYGILGQGEGDNNEKVKESNKFKKTHHGR
jgi:hypothetical protein